MEHAEEKKTKKKKSRNLTPDEAAALKIKEFEESYMNYTVSIEADTEPDENTGKPLHVDKLILTSPPRVVENAGEKTKEEIEKELEQPAGWRRIACDIKALMFGSISFTGRNSKAALQRKENALQVIKAFCAVEFFLDWEYFNVTGPNRYSMYKIDEIKEIIDDAGEPTGAVEIISREAKMAKGLVMDKRLKFSSDALKVYEEFPKPFNINKPPEFFAQLWGHLKTHKATKADTLKDCFKLTATAIDFFKEYRETLQALISRPTDVHCMSNTKVVEGLKEKIGELSAGERALLEVNVAPNKKEEIKTTVLCSIDDPNIKIRKPFTAEDESILNSAASLFEAGNDAFTLEMLYREMAGFKNTEYIQPDTLTKFKGNVDRLRVTLVEIDATQEAKKRYPKAEKTIFSNYAMPIKAVSVKINGETRTAYRFLDKPPLYEYSQMTGQVISLPSELLDVYEVNEKNRPLDTKVAMTTNRIVIRDYLLKTISWIKHGGRNEKIALDTLYEKTIENISGKKISDKQKRSTREFVEKCLKSWTYKQKWIKGYEVSKKGRAIDGFIIKY